MQFAESVTVLECGAHSWSAVWAGCVITAGILFSGFWQFKQGNKQQAQQVFRVGPFPQPLAGQVEALLRPLILALPQMMRARVAAQVVTLSLMMTSLWVQERQKKLGLWPKDPRAG